MRVRVADNALLLAAVYCCLLTNYYVWNFLEKVHTQHTSLNTYRQYNLIDTHKLSCTISTSTFSACKSLPTC